VKVHVRSLYGNGKAYLTSDPLLKKEASSEVLLYKCLGFSEFINREKRTWWIPTAPY